MHPKDLQFFRTILTDWLNQLLAQSDDSFSELQNSAAAPDPVDRASQELSRGYTLKMRDRDRKLTKKIRACLDNIESGIYGICEFCGKDIPIPRLKARPVTSYCVACKTKNGRNRKSDGILK